VVLIGPSGAGKSTFAAAHFRETEIVSSDFCRKLICDDENDQSATSQAFGLLHLIVSRRLARGRRTVVDATNLRRSDRAAMLRIAQRFQRPAVAILFAVSLETAIQRNRSRPGRKVEDRVVATQHELLPAISVLREEGFAEVREVAG